MQTLDIPAYRVLRLENLNDAPCSSGASPGDDPTEAEGFLENFITDPSRHMIVIDHPHIENALASCASLQRYPGLKASHRALIGGVYTTPTLRRQGFARALLDYMIDLAKQWAGLRYLALSVSADSAGAIALYESLGFVQWGTEPDVIHIDGRDYDEVYLTLKL